MLRAVNSGDYLRLVALAAIWGASFLFMRIAAPELGAVLTATARVALEQDDAEPGLELAHMVADRAGGEVQLLGGMGEILVTGGHREHPQRGQQGRAQDHGETQIIFVACRDSTRLSRVCSR